MSAAPNELVAPVVTVAVYCVLKLKLALGVNVAVLDAAEYVTVPATVPPGPFSVKVVALIVAASIVSLNVAVSVELIATPVAASAGVVADTVGGVGGGGVCVFVFE
jgi:hypothetical protein